jgi:hypothetical protein
VDRGARLWVGERRGRGSVRCRFPWLIEVDLGGSDLHGLLARGSFGGVGCGGVLGIFREAREMRRARETRLTCEIRVAIALAMSRAWFVIEHVKPHLVVSRALPVMPY